jgi:hypothetical protein
MATRKSAASNAELPPPAPTLEGRENQLIAAAMDLVERRICEGTASAQETVHFLRLGSVKSQLENDKLKQENIVLMARVEEMKSRTSSEGLYAEALAAFRGYSGAELIEDDDDPHVF